MISRIALQKSFSIKEENALFPEIKYNTKNRHKQDQQDHDIFYGAILKSSWKDIQQSNSRKDQINKDQYFLKS
jgi:hypothetical protein